MTTGEIQQNPEQHRSAVEVAKSYVDRNAEKYNTQQTDQGPGVRNYEVLRTRDGKHGIDVNNNRIEDAAKKEKVEVKK